MRCENVGWRVLYSILDTRPERVKLFLGLTCSSAEVWPAIASGSRRYLVPPSGKTNTNCATARAQWPAASASILLSLQRRCMSQARPQRRSQVRKWLWCHLRASFEISTSPIRTAGFGLQASAQWTWLRRKKSRTPAWRRGHTAPCIGPKVRMKAETG